MEQYIGLLSMKETAISIRQDGKRIWRGKCASDPHLLAAVIRKRAWYVRRVVFETGPLSVWFYHALTAEGLPVICVDARHAKAALEHGREQDRCERCRWPGTPGRGRLLPRPKPQAEVSI